MVSDKIKKVIIDKLYKDLSNVEIISHNGSIWFIDRDAKYWYFELTIKGLLWWRYSFFTDFFSLFSMERNDYVPILSEWVEEVLNCKVLTTAFNYHNSKFKVEEVLNCKVLTTNFLLYESGSSVEEVLNCKVLTTIEEIRKKTDKVEEVLNCKVSTTKVCFWRDLSSVEEVLEYKVLRIQGQELIDGNKMEEVLNYKVV